MSDVRSLSPKQWAQMKREQMGLNAVFEWDAGIMDKFLEQMPLEHQKGAEEVWRSRVGIPISDIHEQQIMRYLSGLRIPKSKALGFEISAEQFILMPTADINAFAGQIPRGDRVVVIHEALTHVVAMFCHWLLFCQETADNRRSMPPDIEMEMERYFLAVWFSDASLQARPNAWPRNQDYWNLSENLSFAVMRFILAHEIGHIFHEHKGYSASREENHSMEFEADKFSLECCVWTGIIEGMKADDSFVTLYSFLGPFFGLAILSVLGSEDSPTHPSFESRVARLLLGFDAPLNEAAKGLSLGKGKLIEFLGENFLETIEDITCWSMEAFSRMRPGIVREVARRPTSVSWIEESLNNCRRS